MEIQKKIKRQTCKTSFLALYSFLHIHDVVRFTVSDKILELFLQTAKLICNKMVITHIYSNPIMIRTPMAHSLWLIRTCFWNFFFCFGNLEILGNSSDSSTKISNDILVIFFSF